MTEIDKSLACFVSLWRRLEPTRQLLRERHKRFCIRRVLQVWFGSEATDDFIWEVCLKAEQAGLEELPPPALYPLRHRELLRAVVAVKLGTTMCKVGTRMVDKAYSIAFPESTPLNVEKKNRRRADHPPLAR